MNQEPVVDPINEEKPIVFKPGRCRIKVASARRSIARARSRMLYEEGLKNNAAVEEAHRQRLADRNAKRNARRESVRSGLV